MSKAVTHTAIATIPCTADIRETVFEINNQRIADPVLIQEVGEFTNQCFAAAQVKFFREKNVSESWMDVSGRRAKWAAGWIGAQIFLDTPGYYDTLTARTPQRLFPWDASRDEALAPGRDGGGYPTCKEWWLDSSNGLRARLKAQIKPGLLEKASGVLRWGEDATDVMIRDLVSPSAQQRSKDMGGLFYNMGPSTATGIAGTADWVRETYNNFKLTDKTGPFGSARERGEAQVQALRTALPMFQSIIIMVLIISLPLIIVLSSYSLRALAAATVGMFSVHFLQFWWELSRWLDSKMLAGLYMDKGAGQVVERMIPLTDHGAAYWMADFVLWASLLGMPVLFLGFMTWAGYRAINSSLGGGDAASSSVGGIAAASVGGAGAAALGAASRAGNTALKAAAKRHPAGRAARSLGNRR